MSPSPGEGTEPSLDMELRIVSLRATGTEADRTVVTLSDDRSFTVATDAVVDLGLVKKLEVGPELLGRLEDADQRFRAKRAALNLLSHRARSRKELRDRLFRKDFPGRVVHDVLDRLESLGLLDDRAFAESYIRDRLRVKPRGRRALRAELARKGVRDEAEPAIEAVFEEEEVSDRTLAREVAEGWLRRQSARLRKGFDEPYRSDLHQKALRRYLGYMGRRGFHAGLARDVLAEVRGEG